MSDYMSQKMDDQIEGAQFAYAEMAGRIVELEAENARLKSIEFAWNEWQDKTEWVQKTAKPRELGMHRADVLRHRIEQAESQRDKLLTELKSVVSCCEGHDKGIGNIVGTPPGWRDAYLDPARSAIAEVEGGV